MASGYRNSTGPATSNQAVDPLANERINQAIQANRNNDECPCCRRKVAPGVPH